ncbi:MAG: hypothetical protein ACLP5H_04480 [Desulfomonilaceae bacterium]
MIFPPIAPEAASTQSLGRAYGKLVNKNWGVKEVHAKSPNVSLRDRRAKAGVAFWRG